MALHNRGRVRPVVIVLVLNPREEKKMSKVFNRAPYQIFHETMEALQMTSTELATTLGYSSTAGSGWKKDDKIPQVAALACEALKRRAGLSTQCTVLLVTVPPNQLHATISVLDALNCKSTKVEL